MTAETTETVSTATVTVEATPGTEDAIRELLEWWFRLSADDGARCVPKAVEYGSGDLIEMGRALAETAHRKVDDAEAAELGIWFYTLGKMARWTNAVKRGERVSDDTLLDITTYSMMARRVREVGGWPGVVL